MFSVYFSHKAINFGKQTITNKPDQKKVIVLFITDILVSVGALVVGILGLLHILPVPPAAAYALIGTAAALILADTICLTFYNKRYSGIEIL